MKKNTIVIVCIIASSLMFMWPSFYNGFPLITADSWAYITSGFTLIPPFARPIAYGLFIRVASLGISSWAVVFVQGLVYAWLLWECTSVVLKNFPFANRIKFYIVSTFVLLLSSLPWYTSLLLADFFSPVIILSFILFLISDKLSIIKKVIYVILCVWGTAAHFSHLPVVLGASLLVFIISVFRKPKGYQWVVRSAVLFACGLLAVLFASSYNFYAGKGFKVSLIPNVFLTGKLCENGILKTYLDESCDSSSLTLCAYKDKLPTSAVQFLFQKNGVLLSSYGWTEKSLIEANKEYSTIVRDVFSSPRFLTMFAWESLKATFVQSTQLNVGQGTNKLDTHSFAYFSEGEYDQFKSGLQVKKQPKLRKFIGFFNIINISIMIISATVCAYYLAFMTYKKEFSVLYLFAIMVILMYFANAAVTGGLANVLPRLQARVSWTIVVSALFILYERRYRIV